MSDDPPDDPVELPQVHFGVYTDQPFDWRKADDEVDPDDELVETPPELIELLGFDPLDLDKD